MILTNDTFQRSSHSTLAPRSRSRSSRTSSRLSLNVGITSTKSPSIPRKLPDGRCRNSGNAERKEEERLCISGFDYKLLTTSGIANSPYSKWLFYSHPGYPRAQHWFDLYTCFKLNRGGSSKRVQQYLENACPGSVEHEERFRQLISYAQDRNWGIVVSLPCERAFFSADTSLRIELLGGRSSHYYAFLSCALALAQKERVFLLPTNCDDGKIFDAYCYTNSKVGEDVRRELKESLLDIGKAFEGRSVHLAGGAAAACLRDSVEFIGKGPRYGILTQACYSNDFSGQKRACSSNGLFPADPALAPEIATLRKVIRSLSTR